MNWINYHANSSQTSVNCQPHYASCSTRMWFGAGHSINRMLLTSSKHVSPAHLHYYDVQKNSDSHLWRIPAWFRSCLPPRWQTSGVCITHTDPNGDKIHADRKGVTFCVLHVLWLHLWQTSCDWNRPPAFGYKKPFHTVPACLQRMMLRLQTPENTSNWPIPSHAHQDAMSVQLWSSWYLHGSSRNSVSTQLQTPPSRHSPASFKMDGQAVYAVCP